MNNLERCIIYIFLLNLFSVGFKCAIYIPFQILDNDTLYNGNVLDIVKYWRKLNLYAELMIGEPPNKIGIFLVSNIYELSILQNMCDISNSFYNMENSSSYNFIKSINYYFNKVLKCSIITEKLYLYTDKEQKNRTSIEEVKMIYSDNLEEDFNQDQIYKDENKDKKYEYHPNTCLNIGFQARQNIGFGGEANFVRQIKNYKINNISLVNTYDYFFDYTSDNNGYLIIGDLPHKLYSKEFKEEQYFLTAAKDKNYTFEWFIEFNSIYYKGKYQNNNSEYNVTINSSLPVKIDLTYGLVEGTNDYEKNIRKDFFDKLINDNECFIEENKNEGYRFYYCNKKNINNIQKNFPSLKFVINEYGMSFEFGFKDLFKEKNDKIYFLIFFNTTKDFERFSFGKIFLKKYILSFNYDNKMIGFYNKNYKNESRKKIIYYEHDKIFFSLIIIGFIIFFIAGFFLGKKIYDKSKKRNANELIDDYDYVSEEKKEEKPENAINN